ncbi:hypothetical protein B4Q13_19700, partial [Lacticaseibacillus rhamnosus]
MLNRLTLATFLALTTTALSAKQPLVVVSVDGLDNRYLANADQMGLKIPNLRKLMREGQVSGGVIGVVPTVTWPSHTTMITGVDPVKHGILANWRPPDSTHITALISAKRSGSSPEPMVQLLDGRVISRPIAGTRRRGRTEADDRRMAAELAEHPKERAEHVMLVDLARNDVGRVVKFGTERMEELMVLERYSHVMPLPSQVAGDRRDDANAVDVLR